MSLPIAYDTIIKVGDKCGTLVVIESPRRIPKSNPKSSPYWMVWVECTCGHKQQVPCGKWKEKLFSMCRRCKIGGNNNYRWNGVGEMPGEVFYNTLHNARRINVEYSVSKDYLWKLFLSQNRKCALSKIALSFHSIGNDKQTASLDRIDSSKGYVEGNVQWIHKDVNKMKNAYDQSYYISICKQIAAACTEMTPSHSNDSLRSTGKNMP